MKHLANAYLYPVLIFTAIALATNGAFAADAYSGILAPSKGGNQTAPAAGTGSSGFSFITPSKEKAKKQNQTLPSSATVPATSQGYKNYASYEEYYKEQEKLKQQQAQQLKQQPQTVQNNDAQLRTQETVGQNMLLGSTLRPNNYQEPDDIKPVTEEERLAYEKLDLKGKGGYPLTATTKQELETLAAQLKDGTISKEQKRQLVSNKIRDMKQMAFGLKMQRMYSGNVYKKMNLPENYTKQLDTDMDDTIAIIESAVTKLEKY